MKEQEEVKRADDEEEDITKIVIEDLKVEEFNDQEELPSKKVEVVDE